MVQGAAEIASTLLNVVKAVVLRSHPQGITVNVGNKPRDPFKLLFIAFLIFGIVWGSVGSKWVYAANASDCDPLLYNFAYAMITMNWILMVVFLGLFILFKLYKRMCGSGPSQ